MGTLVVVAVSPVFGHTAHLVKAGEDVALQDLGAEGAIEAFDIGVISCIIYCRASVGNSAISQTRLGITMGTRHTLLTVFSNPKMSLKGGG